MTRIAVNSRIWEQEPLSGIPLYIEKLYTEAQKVGVDVRFVQVAEEKTLGPTIVPNRHFPAPPPVFDLLLANELAHASEARIFHGPSHLIPLRPKRAVDRYVVTVHDLGFLILPPALNQRRVFNTYYRWAVARSVHSADAVLADSESTSHDLQRLLRVPADKITVVHLGVDEQFRLPAEGPPAIDGRYVLSVSTHPRRKNITRCLEALAAQRPGHSDVRYVVAGALDREQRNDLRQQAASLGLNERLVLFGYATDAELVNLYAHAQCTLYPSFYEGFGLPVAEAMAAGCPVIASNNSSLPEVVGDETWLVDPYSTAAITQALSAMLALRSAERSELADRNRQRMQAFTWTRTLANTLEVLYGV